MLHCMGSLQLIIFIILISLYLSEKTSADLICMVNFFAYHKDKVQPTSIDILPSMAGTPLMLPCLQTIILKFA